MEDAEYGMRPEPGMTLEQTRAFHFDLLEHRLNAPWCRWCQEPLELNMVGSGEDAFLTEFCRQCDGDNPKLAEADAWWADPGEGKG